jgi:hypothetical protein
MNCIKVHTEVGGKRFAVSPPVDIGSAPITSPSWLHARHPPAASLIASNVGRTVEAAPTPMAAKSTPTVALTQSR